MTCRTRWHGSSLLTCAPALGLLAALLTAACGGAAPRQAATDATVRAPAASPGGPVATSSPVVRTADASERATPTSGTPLTTPAPRRTVDPSELPFRSDGWRTDFGRRSVPLGEFLPGGPPRDGIPPIDQPRFVAPAETTGWLQPREPVIFLQLGAEARAYPLQILIWHEIVNDEVGGVPVTVTFCPLCNTAIAFDRRVGGRTLDFGTTGNVRHSDLVMWDRQTESWWQQITGEAVVGELTGARLTMLPATIIAAEEFRTRFPDGAVLSRDTGHTRSYGRNPYEGYDDVSKSPFLFEGKPDGRLRPMERVATVSLGGVDAAYPFTVLAKERVVNDAVGGEPVVVFYWPGTASALDAGTVAAGRDVGSTGAYSPLVDGRRLTFGWRDDAFVDAETGSRWTLLGRAERGPLAGEQLRPLVHGTHFWFAWAVFKPDTRVYGSGDAGR